MSVFSLFFTGPWTPSSRVQYVRITILYYYDYSLLIRLACCLFRCRYGAAELHSIAAFIGGAAAQEVIKIITHQFVPFSNTYIYNAITASSATFQLWYPLTVWNRCLKPYHGSAHSGWCRKTHPCPQWSVPGKPTRAHSGLCRKTQPTLKDSPTSTENISSVSDHHIFSQFSKWHTFVFNGYLPVKMVSQAIHFEHFFDLSLFTWSTM